MSNNSYDPATDPLHPYMFAKITEILIGASVTVKHRCIKCLENHCIIYVGEVVGLSEEQLLRIDNFGELSLRALKLALAKLGLRLGMDVPALPSNRKRLEEVRSQCVKRGLWDFDSLAVQQVNAHDAAYAETIDALRALQREINIVRARVVGLHKRASDNRTARDALEVAE
jgi:hypothetical protein